MISLSVVLQDLYDQVLYDFNPQKLKVYEQKRKRQRYRLWTEHLSWRNELLFPWCTVNTVSEISYSLSRYFFWIRNYFNTIKNIWTCIECNPDVMLLLSCVKAPLHFWSLNIKCCWSFTLFLIAYNHAFDWRKWMWFVVHRLHWQMTRFTFKRADRISACHLWGQKICAHRTHLNTHTHTLISVHAGSCQIAGNHLNLWPHFLWRAWHECRASQEHQDRNQRLKTSSYRQEELVIIIRVLHV